MLEQARICADVPTSDLRRAGKFYEGTLGLKVARADDERGVYFEAGGGTMLNLYEREHSAIEYTVATFLVEDIGRTMSELRARGVVFEEYDEPDLKTEHGVFSDDTGFRASWFKDPDGNVLGLEQLPAK